MFAGLITVLHFTPLVEVALGDSGYSTGTATITSSLKKIADIGCLGCAVNASVFAIVSFFTQRLPSDHMRASGQTAGAHMLLKRNPETAMYDQTVPYEPRILTTTVGSYPVPDWLAAHPTERAVVDATRVVFRHTEAGRNRSAHGW